MANQCFLSCSAIEHSSDKESLENEALAPHKAGLSIASAPLSRIAHSNRPYILGIDPGVKGAVCIYDIQFEKIVRVFDMPIYEIEVKGKKRARIDALSLALKIDAYSPMVKVALIEEVGQIGTNADPFSSFVFGFATGIVHGVLNTCLIPVEVVKPSVWKASYGLSADKNQSLEKAKKLIPESSEFLTLKKHDGRAEAILLALFAFKRLRKA